MPYILGLIGTWLLSDALYSIILYANAPSYDGKTKQTFKRDHWIRVVRAICAIGIIIIGWKLGR